MFLSWFWWACLPGMLPYLGHWPAQAQLGFRSPTRPESSSSRPEGTRSPMMGLAVWLLSDEGTGVHRRKTSWGEKRCLQARKRWLRTHSCWDSSQPQSVVLGLCQPLKLRQWLCTCSFHETGKWPKGFSLQLLFQTWRIGHANLFFSSTYPMRWTRKLKEVGNCSILFRPRFHTWPLNNHLLDSKTFNFFSTWIMLNTRMGSISTTGTGITPKEYLLLPGFHLRFPISSSN